MDTNSTSQLSSKRPRTDTSADTHTQVTRSTPWFEDGNIILEAEGHQFKVFRGILAAKSVVFADMFIVSQPGPTGLVEGCPVIHLSDKAKDIKVILEVLFDSQQ